MISGRPEWQSRAACRGMEPGIFMPERGEVAKVNLARRICAGCPVRVECLDYGIGERFGIWGGMSGKQRRALNRKAS